MTDNEISNEAPLKEAQGSEWINVDKTVSERPTQEGLGDILRFARSFARVASEQRRPAHQAALHRV